MLVVSHNCFSESGSNGRTLANLFYNWPKESLAQFYISSEVPDFDMCENYFRITDIEVLNSFIKGSKAGRIMKKKEYLGENVSLNNLYTKNKNKNKTPFNYIARNLVWDSKRWRSKLFEEWLNNFNPDVILLQLGDYSFMLRNALKIAEVRKIPIIIYNSEDYYFKNEKSFSLLYHYYRYDYKREVKKIVNYSASSIYISEMLQETYRKEFDHSSSVIMTSTEIQSNIKNNNLALRISYLGNLGLGRHEPLIEIANTLNNINPDLFLDVYGKSPNQEVENALQSCSGIRWMGSVTYKEVVKVMESSDVLVHAENFSEFYQKDLVHAFSTKIADSLASACFLVYAPKSMGFIKYLKENNAACIVNCSNELRKKIEQLVLDINLRQSYMNNGIKLARKMHNKKINSNKFRRVVLESLLKE
ncbi:glycosyltransferase [Sporosarcina psychrophila]|uniref:glycosyltransferase n=1 Tax=Sporosarcina psychrophila TaxID=1476 RepID=UPI0030D0E6C9